MEETEQQTNHIMIDIETMGNINNSAIVSLSAVKFDIKTGFKGEIFHRLVNLQSCLDIGLEVNGSTIMWWLDKSDEARNFLKGENYHIKEVLNDFSDFCTVDHEIWGNSPRFDLGIIQNAYNKLKLPIPWDFRKERDVRTLVSFLPKIKENWLFSGVKHNSIDDCYNQIDYCSIIWNKIQPKSRISKRPKTLK